MSYRAKIWFWAASSWDHDVGFSREVKPCFVVSNNIVLIDSNSSSLVERLASCLVARKCGKDLKDCYNTLIRASSRLYCHTGLVVNLI